MNVIKINPLRPFENMARLGDFQEMVVDALSFAFNLSPTSGRPVISTAVHRAYNTHGHETILYDVVQELRSIAENGDATTKQTEIAQDLIRCVESYAVDPAFPEYNIFCERDGHPLNALDVNGLKATLMQASNSNIRAFLERMVVYSLLF